MTLEETLEKIHPANQAAMAASLEHWSNIAMPLHSLGRLQDTVVRIAGMTGDPRVDLKKKALVVMCADNGVVEEGVTQSGQEVTKIVAENFLKEKATASILCKKAGADIFPVDIGIATDSTIIQHKVMYGTKNMAKEPAMTREQAVQALEVGIHMVEELKEKGATGKVEQEKSTEYIRPSELVATEVAARALPVSMDGRGKASLTRMSDRETLERAEKHFGTDAKFSDLYNGKTVLGSEEKSEYALMLRLALFCGNDEEQLLRLFKSSGQFRDEKPNAYYMKLASESMKTIREMRGSIAAAQENNGFTKGKIGINSKR